MVVESRPTKLEMALRARRLESNKCVCDKPEVGVHMARLVFLKCERCGRPLSTSLSHAEAKKYQNDNICV